MSVAAQFIVSCKAIPYAGTVGKQLVQKGVSSQSKQGKQPTELDERQRFTRWSAVAQHLLLQLCSSMCWHNTYATWSAKSLVLRYCCCISQLGAVHLHNKPGECYHQHHPQK